MVAKKRHGVKGVKNGEVLYFALAMGVLVRFRSVCGRSGLMSLVVLGRVTFTNGILRLLLAASFDSL